MQQLSSLTDADGTWRHHSLCSGSCPLAGFRLCCDGSVRPSAHNLPGSRLCDSSVELCLPANCQKCSDPNLRDLLQDGTRRKKARASREPAGATLLPTLSPFGKGPSRSLLLHQQATFAFYKRKTVVSTENEI